MTINSTDQYENLSLVPMDDQTVKLRKDIGSRIRIERKRKGYNLRHVSERLQSLGRSISIAQISRIENGEVAPNTDELVLLCDVLEISLLDLFGPSVEPWFIVRKQVADSLLVDIKEGQREIERRGLEHSYLIEKKTYQYVPLDQNESHLKEGDHEPKVKMKPNMRKYLMEIGGASEGDMERGLDRHSGEEIIFVIKGEIEFWFKQGDRGKVQRKTLNENDCLQVSSNLLHGFRATGRERVAEALFVYSEPTSTPELMELSGDEVRKD